MPLKVPGSGRMPAPPLASVGGDSIYELVNQHQYGIGELVCVITVVGYGCDSLGMTRRTEFLCAGNIQPNQTKPKNWRGFLARWIKCEHDSVSIRDVVKKKKMPKWDIVPF